jgi:hypothetical protein
MKATRISTICLVLGALLLLVPMAGAQELQRDPERFRAELLAYVQDLSRLSPAVIDRVYKKEFSLAQAEATINALTHDELRAMEQHVSLIPFWREVPQMIAEKSLTDPGMQIAANAAPDAVPPLDAEALRAPMLAFVNSLRQMPVELVGSEYHQRLDRVDASIRAASPSQLAELQLAFNRQMPVWSEATSRKPGRLRIEVQNHCGSAFPSSVLCELNHVFNTIAAIPGQVASFATDAVNLIGNELKKLFETIKEAIPTSPSGVLSLLKLGGSVDYGSLVGSIPEIKPPCPSSVPGIGTVGDINAMYVCQRGPEFLGRALFNIFPKDLWGMKPKIAAGLFYFPWTYLCGTCFGGQYERDEHDRVLGHRALLLTNLNVQASTLADQASVNAVQGGVSNVAGDVVRVHSKIDGITQKTDEQLRRLDVVVSTRASETSVDGARTAANDVVTDVAKAESKLDQIGRDVLALIAEQNKTSASLASFRDIAIRQRIEDDLIRNATTDRIGLFETPQAQGGLLEVAMAIVQDTLTKRQAAGADVKGASKDFQQAQTDYSNRAFKNAYTSLRKAYQTAVQ